MFCGKCGSNVDGMKFCGVCGAPVGDGNEAEAAASQQYTPPVQQATSPVQQAVSPVPMGVGGFQDASNVPGAQQVNAGQFGVAGAIPNAGGVAAKPPLSPKAKIIRIAIGIVLVAAVVVAALFMLGILPPSTPIDAKTFPNAVIRNALLEQADRDGNGRLSAEEASSITALVYTPNGAMFFADNVQVDVDEACDVLASQAEANPAQAQMGTSETAIPDMDVLPNISTIVIRDPNITTIDATKVPNAEYVDLRGTGITSLDLSSNDNLTALFCDPEVQLYGLEDAGLYFTDLITSYKESWNSDDKLTVEYDSLGRPMSMKKYDITYSFSYDDQGKLIRISDDRSGYDTEYQYAANGLISSYSYTPGIDVTETRNTIRFGYDANGELTQIADMTDDTETMALAYDGTHLASAKDLHQLRTSSGTSMVTDFAKYQYDDAGRMTNEFSGTNPKLDEKIDYSNNYFSQTASQYTYNDINQVTSIAYENELDCSATAAIKTEFSMTSEGFPARASVTMLGRGSSPQTYSKEYTCNSDGYIVSAKGDYTGSSSSSADEVTYVKMVGSLSDRPSRRFVPVLRVSIVPNSIGNGVGTPAEYLKSTDCIRGDWWPFDVLLMQPQCTLLSHLNIVPNYLFNPNEMSLARYDEEHWTDGLDLSVGALPIQDQAVQTAIEASASVELPANPTSFLNDPVYGSVVEEYMAFARYLGDMSDSARENALRSSSLDSKFPRAANQFFLSQDYYSDDSFNYGFSYVDLNADGINELAVSITYGHYPTAIDAFYANDNGTPKLLAESAYRDPYALTANNCIVESGSGGFDLHRSVAYTLEGAQLKQVGLYEFEYVDSDDRGSDSSLYQLNFQLDGGEVQHLTVPLSQIDTYGERFRAAYPIGVSLWTCLW